MALEPPQRRRRTRRRNICSIVGCLRLACHNARVLSGASSTRLRRSGTGPYRLPAVPMVPRHAPGSMFFSLGKIPRAAKCTAGFFLPPTPLFSRGASWWSISPDSSHFTLIYGKEDRVLKFDYFKVSSYIFFSLHHFYIKWKKRTNFSIW